MERDGLGGAAVLTDCVPSKALIATAESMGGLAQASSQGVRLDEAVHADLALVNDHVLRLARAQSADIGTRLTEVGVRVLAGMGRLVTPTSIAVETPMGDELVDADVVLVATGAMGSGS